MTPSTPVFVSAAEHRRLLELAYAALGREPGAETLVEELARADVQSVDATPLDAVGIGDVVDFTYDGARRDGFTLVYPHEADIAAKRISVLSPVGAMLLGIAAGATISWTGADGREHRVTIETVVKGRPAA